MCKIGTYIIDNDIPSVSNRIEQSIFLMWIYLPYWSIKCTPYNLFTII